MSTSWWYDEWVHKYPQTYTAMQLQQEYQDWLAQPPQWLNGQWGLYDAPYVREANDIGIELIP